MMQSGDRNDYEKSQTLSEGLKMRAPMAQHAACLSTCKWQGAKEFQSL